MAAEAPWGGLGPARFPPWPDTDKRRVPYDPVVRDNTGGAMPGSGGSDMERAREETPGRSPAGPDALKVCAVRDPAD